MIGMKQRLGFSPTDSTSPVPPWLARVARIGTIGFGLAVGLIALGFLTNVQPYPYFDWLTPSVTPLPAQPRLGHYPLSITVGTWLWEFTFPFVLLWVADRYELGTLRARTVLFILIPAVYALGFHLYCRFIFPQPTPSLWEPAVTAVCYIYCQTYALSWSYITLGTVALGLFSATRPEGDTIGWVALVLFGVLTFPLGITPLYEAVTRRKQSNTGNAASTPQLRYSKHQ